MDSILFFWVYSLSITFASAPIVYAFVSPSSSSLFSSQYHLSDGRTHKPAATASSLRVGDTDIAYHHRSGGFSNGSSRSLVQSSTMMRSYSLLPSLSTATNSTSSSLSALLSKNKKMSISVGVWCVLDVIFRRIFQGLNMATKFPSSLAGCGFVLAFLLLSEKTREKYLDVDKKPNKGSYLYRTLSPGAALLAKWLPVFFVPSLVTLPLVDSASFGGLSEMLKMLFVLLSGFQFTLLTTAGTVLVVGNLVNKAGSDEDISEEKFVSEDSDLVVTTAMPPKPAKEPLQPFSDRLMKNLRIIMIFSGLAALEGASPVFSSFPARFLVKHKTGALSTLLGSTTLASFVFGSRLSKETKKMVHPLITCTTITWTVMALFAKCTEQTFASVLSTFKMGHGFNGIHGTGAGDIMMFMLGPAILSLSISMFEKRRLICDNFVQILLAVSVSSISGLLSTAWMVQLLGLAAPSLRIALLSKNITSPLAMAIASLLGASTTTISIAVTLVVITGLFGANFGARILTMFGITNPVARGMGIGAAAHGLGTASIVDEKEAFPFAAISMALTATAATCLVSVPIIKELVLHIALKGVQ